MKQTGWTPSPFRTYLYIYIHTYIHGWFSRIPHTLAIILNVLAISWMTRKQVVSSRPLQQKQQQMNTIQLVPSKTASVYFETVEPLSMLGWSTNDSTKTLIFYPSFCPLFLNQKSIKKQENAKAPNLPHRKVLCWEIDDGARHLEDNTKFECSRWQIASDS